MLESEPEGTGRRPRPRRRSSPEELRGRLRPHDPFELIRWLALSQPDPRKALAELVQNSLDAGAGKVRVIRVREKGVPCLRILDDGAGVIPEMARRDALHFIATHIGHSRKRSLSPQQRLELLTQGQYGIGLLGFWSLGETLEIRSSLPGQKPFRLVLHRDRPDFRIEPLRGRLPLDGRWTEVVVTGVHREAMPALGGRRAADFLASELRGQLLMREVDLLVEDRMSRGRSQKIVPVRPPRFLGERIEALSEIAVPEHAPIRLEIYLSAGSPGEHEPRGIAVYSSGTLVAESFHELASLGLDRPPWTDARLSGLVDYPDFHVAPGSRRGVVPDEAAGAFARAIDSIETVIAGIIAALEKRKSEELDRTLVRDLQRAFRDFYRQRPRYSMLPVSSARPHSDQTGDKSAGAGAGSRSGSDEGLAEELPPAEAGQPAVASGEDPDFPPSVAPDLLPAGPLACLRISPSAIRVECRGSRAVRVAALDASGRPVEAPVLYSWSVEGPVGSIEPDPARRDRVVLRASEVPGEGLLRVTARSEERDASIEAPVQILDEIASRTAEEGIPEPGLVHEPGAAWRSRMVESRWQVNTAHRDYRAIADRPALKLRYLATLFAKEVVLRSSQDPRLERPLEQLVEVAAYADRNLSTGRGRAKGSPADI